MAIVMWAYADADVPDIAARSTSTPTPPINCCTVPARRCGCTSNQAQSEDKPRMTMPHNTTSFGPDGKSAEAARDQALRQSLRELPCTAEPAQLAALEARVLAQWEASHPAPGRAAGRSGVLAAPSPRGWLKQRWVRVSGLVCGVALSMLLAQGLGLRIPGLGSDPALDELMQMDVLSQMAIGEM